MREIERRCRPSRTISLPRGVLYSAEDPALALTLRTVDDVYLGGVVDRSIGHTRAALADIARVVRAADPTTLIAAHRGMSPRAIGVTASFVGKRNYNRFEVEDTAGSELGRLLGLPYLSRRDHPPATEDVLSWRIHLEQDVTLFGLRLAERPLHRRGYKQSSIPGTLHPPVAAALVELAHPSPGTLLIDPTCGAATVAIEAKHVDPTLRVLGADVERGALAAATANVSAAGVEVDLVAGDATALPLRDSTASTIITNPPWGRQATPLGGLRARGPTALWSELVRALRPGGRLLVLTEEDAPRPYHPRLDVTDRVRLSLRGTTSIITTLELA